MFAVEGDDAAQLALSDKWLQERSSPYLATVCPFDGNPLEVSVAVTQHISAFGRRHYDFQFKRLVVIAELEGGRRIEKVVDIPHRETARSVVISIP